MSQRSRLGLTDLAGLRKPLVQTPPESPEVPAAVAVEVLPKVPAAVPAAEPAAAPAMAPSEGPPAVLPRILQQRQEKKRLVSQSFKLPADLEERWARVASFNKVTKTGILLEALETFLDRLPEPPPER
jgi:hypothetical protein